MNKRAFCREWIRDLRSGQFAQGRGFLKFEGRYCPLGVACETGKRLGLDGAAFGEDQDELNSVPGQWFVDIFGESNPNLGGDTVAYLNDTQKLSFKEIAQRIYDTFVK